MIDRKLWLSRDQINALPDNEKVEFYNAWANYWRYDIGINVMPAAWRIVDKEKKFIPIIPWKEYQDKPIHEKIHQEWIDNGSFVTGIAGIFGPVWHRPDKQGYYFGQIDADNALAIKEIIAWKGDPDIAIFARRTIVEQHADNLENSMHIGLYSKRPLTNKDADVPKTDKERPSFEVHCVGRMGIMSASKHRKGHPMMLLNSGAAMEPMTLEDDHFEQYLNSICIKHGLQPYLGNGNSEHTENNGTTTATTIYEEHNDGMPLNNELAQMLKKGPSEYDERIEVRNGTRHKTMLKIADSILFRYSDEHDLRVLKDWFILINEHCCKPDPLLSIERDQIWDAAVDYVGKQKALERKRILTTPEAVRESLGSNEDDRVKLSAQVIKLLEPHIELLFKNRTDEKAFAAIQINEHREVVPIHKSKRFDLWVRKSYYDQTGDTLGSDILNEVVDTLESKALFDGQLKTLNLRVGKDPQDDFVYWYDLCNENWEAIRITKDGCSIVKSNEVPIIFRRYSGHLAQVYPTKDYPADIMDQFINLINLKDSENTRLLVKCYIIVILIPEIAKPMLMVHGPKGAAKTALEDLLKLLLDAIHVNDYENHIVKQHPGKMGYPGPTPENVARALYIVESIERELTEMKSQKKMAKTIAANAKAKSKSKKKGTSNNDGCR